MQTNDIFEKITTALSLDVATLQEVYNLAKYPIDTKRLEALLSLENGDSGECSYEELGVFLDGLIILKRGPNPNKPNSNVDVILTNNLILKKLRIALNLKEIELEIIFGLADVELTKQQLSSLFRKEGNKNYRICSDELLFSFLHGLDEFHYEGEIE